MTNGLSTCLECFPVDQVVRPAAPLWASAVASGFHCRSEYHLLPFRLGTASAAFARMDLGHGAIGGRGDDSTEVRIGRRGYRFLSYGRHSAIAAVEPEVKLGRQRGGQRPFSPQGGPMTAHQFRLQPDPTLCGLSSFHKQTVGSVTRRRREPPSATVKLPLNGPTNGCSTGTDGRNTGLVAKADVEAMSAQKAYAAPHSVI